MSEITKNLSNYPQSEEDIDNDITSLKYQLQFYKQQNQQYDKILHELKLIPENLDYSIREILDKFAELQQSAGTNSFDSINIQTSFLNSATEKNEYHHKINELKECLESLYFLIDDISKQTLTVEKEMANAEQNVETELPVSHKEIGKLELQIKSYEDKLQSFMTTSASANPEYNLLSIQEEIKKVHQQQEKIKRFKMGHDKYQGLKPDLLTAKNQLSRIKTEYESIRREIEAAKPQLMKLKTDCDKHCKAQDDGNSVTQQ